MGDQDQQNGEGQSDQQNQTDGQSNAQTPPVAKQAVGDRIGECLPVSSLVGFC